MISATLLTLTLVPTVANVYAKNVSFTSSTKNTSAITVKKVDYDIDDYETSIDLDFTSNIKLKSNASVTLKDSTGKSYRSVIDDYDRNEIDIDTKKLTKGKSYTLTVNGIRKTSAAKYGSLTVKFKIPKTKVNVIKEVEYDADDHELSFDFTSNVAYKNLKVKVTSLDGSKVYKTTVIEKEDDELTVRVLGLTYGKKYKYELSGVSTSQISSTKVHTGNFIARD